MTILDKLITAGTLLGLALLLLAIIIVIIQRRHPEYPLVKLGKRFGLFTALVVVLLAVIGSLYFSQVLLYAPCNLCWWQRVCMFPLLIMLGLALWKRDLAVKKYALSLSGIGALFAVYNAYIQQWPPVNQQCALGGLVDCSSRYVFTLGFITIPLMSLVAFLLVMVFLALWQPDNMVIKK